MAVGINHIMATAQLQDHEALNGWPLGLEVMNTTLQVEENSQAAAPVTQPHSLHIRSTSFSSFSSSYLDTQSSASFFKDHSVSLGRLIGFQPVERKGLYVPNTALIEEPDEGISAIRESCADVSTSRRVDMFQSICIPVLMCAFVKMRRTRTKADHNSNVSW
ncbi:hypothetical protein ACFE04_001288 [Oxalis oulophora]